MLHQPPSYCCLTGYSKPRQQCVCACMHLCCFLLAHGVKRDPEIYQSVAVQSKVSTSKVILNYLEALSLVKW